MEVLSQCSSFKTIFWEIVFCGFCSGQLHASDRTEMETDKPSQAAFPINDVPGDALKLILTEVSKVNNPVTFCLVSKKWKSIMDANNNPSKTQLFENQGLFMQQCMNVWWAEKFKNGVLEYKPEGSKGLALKFADLENVFKGTFDLSACGDASTDLVITTDMESFLKIGGGNQTRTVILIALRQMVEQEINSAEHPFSSIMTGWDAAKAPIGIFWRWSGEVNLSWFDYLIVSSLSVISSKSLYENWRWGRTRPHSPLGARPSAARVLGSGNAFFDFSCLFCEPK